MQEQFNGKRTVFSIIGAGTIPHPCAKKTKKESRKDLILVMEICSKWIRDLTNKFTNIKLLEENIGEYFMT